MSIITTSASALPKSVEFDGTGNQDYDRITCPVNGGEAANIGATDFTIETWIKPTSSNDNTGSFYYQANIFFDRDLFDGESLSLWFTAKEIQINGSSVAYRIWVYS